MTISDAATVAKILRELSQRMELDGGSGVLMARKGGVPKERVLNALNLAQFTPHVEGRKTRRKAMNEGRSTPRSRTKGIELAR